MAPRLTASLLDARLASVAAGAPASSELPGGTIEAKSPPSSPVCLKPHHPPPRRACASPSGTAALASTQRQSPSDDLESSPDGRRPMAQRSHRSRDRAAGHHRRAIENAITALTEVQARAITPAGWEDFIGQGRLDRQDGGLRDPDRRAGRPNGRSCRPGPDPYRELCVLVTEEIRRMSSATWRPSPSTVRAGIARSPPSAGVPVVSSRARPRPDPARRAAP